MTAPTLSLTKSQTLTALGTVLQQILPNGVQIVVAQDNLVAEPPAADFVVMSQPTPGERLSTNITTYVDGGLDVQPVPGTRSDLMPRKVTVQVDVHGPNADDNAAVIQAMLRSDYGVSLFKALPFDVTPLYTSDPRQIPFLNESQQVEDRVVIDVYLQCNPVVTVGQDFADTLAVGLISVDATYPPTSRALRIQGSQIVHSDTGAVAKLRGWNWGIWDTVQPTDAVDAIAQGATIVRIPLRWWGLYNTQSFDSFDPSRPLTGFIDYKHLEYLDAMMALAAKAKLYIILFTDSQCGQSGLQPDGFGGPESLYCDPQQQFINGRNFWTDPQMFQMYLAMWAFIAQRYASNPYFAFAEPMVEPNPVAVSDADISKLYQAVFKSLRPLVPGLLFICGGQSYQAFKIGQAYINKSTDVVYTADMFMQFGSDHAGNIADFTTRLSDLQLFVSTTGAPVLVQQCGVTYNNDQTPLLDYTNSMLSQLNAAGLPWVWWTYYDSNTNGFGPYYDNGAGGRGVHTDFLTAITSYMQAP